MKLSPEQKSLKFLKQKRWYFDDEHLAAKELKNAYKKNTLIDTIEYLRNKTDWAFYTIRDIINLDKSKKIFLRKYEKTKPT